MSKAQKETTDVLLAMEHIRGRRPTTKLEFYAWLTEFDDESRKYAEQYEEEVGSKNFEQILGFSPMAETIH